VSYIPERRTEFAQKSDGEKINRLISWHNCFGIRRS
jgi:hypothetical protein